MTPASRIGVLPLLALLSGLVAWPKIAITDEWEEYSKKGLAPVEMSGKYIDSLMLAYSDFSGHLKRAKSTSDVLATCYSAIENYLVKIEDIDPEIVITFEPRFATTSKCFDTFGGGGKYWISPTEQAITKKLFTE